MPRLVCFALAGLCCLAAGRLLAQDASVEALTAKVSNTDPQVALAALNDLERLGAGAKASVPAVIGALRSDDAQVRAEAGAVLAAIGPDAAAAVDALTAALADEVPEVRAYAAFALGQIGEAAEPAVETLLKAAFDTEPIVRRAAMRALRSLDRPGEADLPFIEKLLTEGDPSLIVQVLQSMSEYLQEGVPQLRAMLKKPTVAYWGAVLAADLGPKAAPAVPELTELLKHAEPEVRLQVLIALGEIGPPSASAVPEILNALTNDELTGVRFAAAFALGTIGRGGEEVNHALVEAARTDEPMLKMLSLWALARLNPEEERVVRYAADTIAAGLTSEDPYLRSASARALADFKGHPDIVAPALIDALDDADPAVVGNALDALATLGPVILDKLDDVLQQDELRHFVTRLIYRMGDRAASTVPALVEALKEEPENEDDVRFRAELQLALAGIGPAAAPAVPELIKSLSSKERDVRGTACYALGKIGDEAAAAVPELKRCVEELGPDDQLPFLWTLLKLQPNDRELGEKAVPLLTAALDSPDPLVRAEAADALGQLGESAKPALEALRQRMQDPSREVRQAAETALQRLGATEAAPKATAAP